jgi:hypothetical protein
MVELLLSEDKALFNDNTGKYPAPIVRLELMVQTVKKLGLKPAKALGPLNLSQLQAQPPSGLDERQVQRVKADFALAPKQVKAAFTLKLDGSETLNSLFNWRKSEFEAGQPVALWARALRDRTTQPTEKGRRSARQIISASIKAWESIAADPNRDESEDRQRQLAEDLCNALVEHREEGERAATPKVADYTGLGAALAEKLLGRIQSPA